MKAPVLNNGENEHGTDDTDNEAGFPIRTMSALTGVNPFTLRAWERRYQLVKPARTPSGQRIYTQRHIDQIKRVLVLLNSGMAIGQIAGLLANTDAEPASGQRAGPWPGLRQRLLDAISQFDEPGLEAVYQDALSLHPVEHVTNRLFLPLLQDLGTRWLDSAVGIAEEHFFSVYLRNKLGARFHHRSKRDEGPRILCACLPGERHELGLLLFALAAHERGYQAILLGADMPLGGLAATADRLLPQGITLSAWVNPGAARWQSELGNLVAAVKVPVFIGGPLSLTHPEAITGAGAYALGCDFSLAFKRMAEVLQHQTTRRDG